MAEGEAARARPVVDWAPAQRRKASLGATIAAVVLVLFAVAAFYVGGAQAETFFLAILAVLVLVTVFQLLVVVTGLRQAPLAAAEGGSAAGGEAGGWAPPEAPAAPAQAPAAEVITLKCATCGTVFDVADTGARPLRHTCPGCGASGELTEADLGPAPWMPPAETASAEPPAPPAEEAPAITLKCGNCGTVFDVTDTGERPLRHVCPGCNAEGELGEEDLGPASAAEPPAPAEPEPPAPRAASRGGPRQKVKTLKLRCKNCSTVFTLRDTGERPLYHECPGCKATGVLR